MRATPTRRSLLAGAGSLALLPACASPRNAPRPFGGHPGTGLMVERGGEVVLSRTNGLASLDPPRAFTANTPFRVASISKLAVARTAQALVARGTLQWDADLSEALGQTFRHPAFPTEPITLERLLSHTSGLQDPPAYWVAAPGNIRSLLTPDIFAPDAEPGQFFRYSNLNYGLAATLLEATTDTRFDRLASTHALAPLGVEAGFNWSGVSPAIKSRGATLYRGEAGMWEAQVDDAETLSSPLPSVLAEDSLDLAAHLEAYIPGTNGTLFSPQGGLRASLSDLLAMGRTWLMDASTEPVWNAAEQPGDTADGHFVAFGRGHYIYPPERSPIPGVRLVGHVGEAYGFHGGLWAAPAHDTVFAFGELGSAPEGVPMTGSIPNLRATNAAFFAEVAPYLR